MKQHPAEVAFICIEDIMAIGTSKQGRPHWREENQDYHLDRAIRHICTYRLIRDGNQSPDDDNHLKLALTRIAMALVLG